jgi:hypothetical protein
MPAAEIALQIISAIEGLLTVAQQISATDPVLKAAQAAGTAIPDAAHQAQFDAIRASMTAVKATLATRVVQ